jgi:hypothetical protein
MAATNKEAAATDVDQIMEQGSSQTMEQGSSQIFGRQRAPLYNRDYKTANVETYRIREQRHWAEEAVRALNFNKYKFGVELNNSHIFHLGSRIELELTSVYPTRETEEWTVALAMARHPRLGKNSLLARIELPVFLRHMWPLASDNLEFHESHAVWPIMFLNVYKDSEFKVLATRQQEVKLDPVPWAALPKP